MPSAIKTFADLTVAERERLFTWLGRTLPGRFATLDAMTAAFGAAVLGHGRTHVSLWRGEAPAGAVGVITREIALKGVVYLVGPCCAHGDREAFRALLASARTLIPDDSAFEVRLGTSPEAPHLAAFAAERGFTHAYDLLEMSYAGPTPPPAPGPGIRFEALADGTEATYRAVSNAAFEDTPGGATLTPADVASMRAERSHPDLIGIGWVDEEPIASYCLAVEDGEGVIEGLAILPGHRGRGRGRALLLHAIGVLRGHDAAPITLQVATSNARALHLYRSAGFGAARPVSHWWRRTGL